MFTYDLYPLVLQALDKISQGVPETTAVNEVAVEGRVAFSVRQFKKAINDDKELMFSYQESLQLGYDALAAALLSPETGRFGTTDVKKMKVYSDNIKWYLEKLDSKRFGQKVEVKQEVTVAFAITDQLERARARSQMALPPVEDGSFIDAEYEMVDEADEFMKQFAV